MMGLNGRKWSIRKEERRGDERGRKLSWKGELGKKEMAEKKENRR